MKYFVVIAILMSLLIFSSCTTTQKGALGGAALGAGAGAVIGHNSNDNAGQGAVIGALAGGLIGALLGDAYEDHQEKKAARRREAYQDYSQGDWATYEDMWD